MSVLRVGRLFVVIVVILLGFYVYDGWISGKERLLADIYTPELKADHVMIIDDGVIKDIRPKNFFDDYNIFVKKYSDHIVLPGLVNPLAGSQCVVGYETPPAPRLKQWLNDRQNSKQLYIAAGYDPWITELGEYIGVPSLYVKPDYIHYISALRLAEFETTTYLYPGEPLEGLGLPANYIGNSLSYGLKEESGTEIKVRLEQSEGPFFLHVYSGDEVVSAHRFGLLTNRTVLVLHGTLTPDAEGLIEYSDAGLVLTDDSLTLGRAWSFPSLEWGAASGDICGGENSVYDLIPILRSHGLTYEQVWDKLSRVNAKILGLSPRGTLTVGAPADFVILKTDTYEGISPARLESIYRDGENLLTSSEVKPLKRTVQQLREELDDLARSEGKHLGQAERFGAKRII